VVDGDLEMLDGVGSAKEVLHLGCGAGDTAEADGQRIKGAG
jgi:hypothetical protein